MVESLEERMVGMERLLANFARTQVEPGPTAGSLSAPVRESSDEITIMKMRFTAL